MSRILKFARPWIDFLFEKIIEHKHRTDDMIVLTTMLLMSPLSFKAASSDFPDAPGTSNGTHKYGNYNYSVHMVFAFLWPFTKLKALMT